MTKDIKKIIHQLSILQADIHTLYTRPTESTNRDSIAFIENCTMDLNKLLVTFLLDEQEDQDQLFELNIGLERRVKAPFHYFLINEDTI
jgi:hypothetical protein